MSVTIDEMRPKLHTVDQLRARLESTEPLTEHVYLPSSGKPAGPIFDIGMGVSGGLSPERFLELQDTDLVGEFHLPGGTEWLLTKESLLEATSMAGLPRGYVERTPLSLIQPLVNYWIGASPKGVKALVMDDAVHAFTRPTVFPYSNVRLLDEALASIEATYGTGTEVLVDYKSRHELRKTAFRLIVPDTERDIDSARHTTARPDTWSTGVQVRNSLTGTGTTNLNGYLFAWTCTNGMTSQLVGSGNWSRRGAGAGDEVYEWARSAVDEILGGLEHEFEALDQLPQIELEGEVNDAVRDIFERYAVPMRARESIIQFLVETDDLTAYGLHAAITQSANLSDASPELVERMLEIGGSLPHALASRCEACHRVVL